jgi:hypothetical protein
MLKEIHALECGSRRGLGDGGGDAGQRAEHRAGAADTAGESAFGAAHDPPGRWDFRASDSEWRREGSGGVVVDVPVKGKDWEQVWSSSRAFLGESKASALRPFKAGAGTDAQFTSCAAPCIDP